ncbi:Ribonuclease/ribotoxin [Stachybotrys elegans]|uniref:ribonuclease T1 n=1 Tax=Stachybotrys elegans TaxID=80388 RepID=A0A8K0WST4_9HYPO|nr:Ribonuclease/ribotoxin [Stachybotrys elegans]
MQFPVVLLSLAALVAAAPATELDRRVPATCGNVYYSAAAVSAASRAACNYVRNGGTAGSSSYPHRYNNYEGFHFNGYSGPFQEFPILSSGAIYSGGSPGPDRVIITQSGCLEAGTITHTGASGNAFVACSGTSRE